MLAKLLEKMDLTNKPTTNFKTVIAVYAAILSVIAYWIATFLFIPVESVTLGLLFGFILTWLFDGRKQFEIKRRTQWKPGEIVPAGEFKFKLQQDKTEQKG